MQNSGEYTQRVVAELRAHMARQRVRAASLAVTVGENAMWVSRRLNGQVDLTIEDLVRICVALDLEPKDVLAAAQDPAYAP